MKEALAFAVLSNFSSIQFSGSSTCLDYLRARSLPRDRGRVGGRTLLIRTLFSSFLWAQDVYHWAHSSPRIECDSGGHCHPVWLHWVSSALSPCGCWPLWPVYPEHLQLVFLTSSHSWLSWILDLFPLPSPIYFWLALFLKISCLVFQHGLSYTPGSDLDTSSMTQLAVLVRWPSKLPAVPTWVQEAPLPLTLFPQGRGLDHSIHKPLEKREA